MAQPKLVKILTILAMNCMAPLAAWAGSSSKLPILHLVQKQAKGEAPQTPYSLVGALEAGKPGMACVYHQDPQITADGPLAGLASIEPDDILMDFSKAYPLEFKGKEMWLIFHPAPKSKMTYVIEKKGEGESGRAGVLQVKMNGKNEAYFRKIQWNAPNVFYDRGALAQDLLMNDTKKLTEMTWVLIK